MLYRNTRGMEVLDIKDLIKMEGGGKQVEMARNSKRGFVLKTTKNIQFSIQACGCLEWT